MTAPTPSELEELIEKVATGMRPRLYVHVLRHAPRVGPGWLSELSAALAADALAVVREALREPTPEMVEAARRGYEAGCQRGEGLVQGVRDAIAASPLGGAK